MAFLKFGEKAVLQTISDTLIAIAGGTAVSQRHMEWNFASSSRARIEQAEADWVAGHCPKVPGDEEELIPLPEGP